MDAVLLAALICGCVAAFKGKRTAWFLLASAAFTSALTLFGMEFNAFFWMLVDFAVVMAIASASSPMTKCDVLIVALFIPAWAAYPFDGWTAYYISSAVVTAQFLLLFPVPQLWAGLIDRLKRTPPPDNLEFARA